MGASASAVSVGLPAPFDRRVRFGPFPSVREALRFVAYSAVGALLIPWYGALAWLPVLGMGFLLTVVQVDGRSLDVLLATRCRAWERELRPAEATVKTRVRRVRAGVAEVVPGEDVTVLRCHGRPISFLPPEELRRIFEQYRELLRSIEGGVVMVAVGLPVDPTPWIPPSPPEGRVDAPAQRGYAEMVGLLLRRRSQRRVYVLQWARRAEGAGRDDLGRRTEELRARLASLGVAPERLEGGSLAAALRRFGWSEPPRESA